MGTDRATGQNEMICAGSDVSSVAFRRLIRFTFKTPFKFDHSMGTCKKEKNTHHQNGVEASLLLDNDVDNHDILAAHNLAHAP